MSGRASLVVDIDTRPAPIDVLCLRAWARARLVSEGMLGLQEAVDELQAAADRDGLVAELGQDPVQRLIAQEFGAIA